MTHKSKQIVIDKDAFVGIRLDSLRSFAANHLLLLSDALVYECATARRQCPKGLLDRYEAAVRAGAYYCSMSRTFVEWDCRQCRPYPWFLPDLTATEQIRRGEGHLADLLNSSEYAELSQQSDKVARAFLNVTEKVTNRIDVEDPRVGNKIRQLPSDKYERFRILFGFVDSGMLHESGIESVPHGWIEKPEHFCLSPDWISWQRVRLADVIANNYLHLRQTGGAPSESRAEHDYQDMEYVLLLSRADGILTRDKKLVEPLARAAFPEKDVFSSLKEVPESYRCDWAGD
jgi:hypothetical protein